MTLREELAKLPKVTNASDGQYSCPLCDYSTFSADRMASHLYVTHIGELFPRILAALDSREELLAACKAMLATGGSSGGEWCPKATWQTMYDAIARAEGGL